MIDFPEGVVGVVGLNGVGKSTIFEAFAWSLYGPFAARTSSDKIKRDGASSSDSCRVEAEFIFNENRYLVIREMLGKMLSSSAKVLMNGRVVATGADATTRYMQKLFGMDSKSFFTSIFAKQKELNVLSSMYASERRKLIMKMLGVDSIDVAIKKIRLDIRTKEEMIKRSLSSILDETTGKKKIDLYKTQIEKKIGEIEKIKYEINKQKSNISSISESLKKIENDRSKAKKHYEELQKVLEQHHRKKEMFDKKKSLEEDVRNLSRSIAEREEIKREKMKELSYYKDISKRIDEVEGEIDKIRKKASIIIKNLQKNETRLDQLNDELKKIKEKRKNIESLGPSAPCPTCSRILGEHYHVLLDRFDEEILNDEKIIVTIKEKIEKLNQENEKLKKLESALTRKRTYLYSMKSKSDRASAMIDSIGREIDRERKQIEKYKGELNALRDVDFNEEEYNKIQLTVRKQYEMYQTLITNAEGMQEELHRARENLRIKEGRLNLVNQQKEEIDGRIEEQNNIEIKIKEDRKMLSTLKLLEDAVSSFRTDIVSRIRPTLSDYASSLFEELTDGKYNEIEVDEDYNIMIYDGGMAYEIDRFSGGEEDLANLCIRLSISQMLAEKTGGEFNMIILDEIFGSQDHNRRRNILSALGSLSHKFRQIFLITHIEDIKEFVDNYIYVYESENGTSNVRLE